MRTPVAQHHKLTGTEPSEATPWHRPIVSPAGSVPGVAHARGQRLIAETSRLAPQSAHLFETRCAAFDASGEE
jgi:hypothetical protein